MTEMTPKWVRAWKCTDCGHCWWGEYITGTPAPMEFCEDCGNPVILGAAQVEGKDMMKNAPFKPASVPSSAPDQAFVCTHCGAPNALSPSGRKA